MTLPEPRIFLTGTGGQGTLTATHILGEAAMEAGVKVTAGEIHGMAQRGGVVESCLLLGGWQATRIDLGEADILLGFEALETLRALPYLKKGGIVFGSTQQIPPLSVAMGECQYPSLNNIKSACSQHAKYTFFLPCEKIAEQAGNPKAANSCLLGALCASGFLPFGSEYLARAIEKILPQKLHDANLKAMEAGAEAFLALERI